MSRTLLSAGVMAIAVAACAATSAQAAFDGSNGAIVFQTNRDGNAEIYTMNSDGTARVNLTRNSAEDTQPRWSQDGSRIAFSSNRGGGFDIYTMNADGSDVRRITDAAEPNRSPAWTDDGRVIFQSGAFGSRRLDVVNADGTGRTTLATGGDSAWAAASPRGPWVVYSHFSDVEGQHLVALNLNSRATAEITPPSSDYADYQANWSPSGNNIVFVRSDASGEDVYAVHRDGTGLRRVTTTPSRSEATPVWSPDGTKIAFHGCSGSGGDQYCANYVANAGGTREIDVSLRPQSPYVDSFTGNWIDPFWWTGWLVGSGLSFQQTGGQLQIDVPATATLDPNTGFAATGLMSQCLLTGQWDIEADYNFPALPPDNGVLQSFQEGEFLDNQWITANGVFVSNSGGAPSLTTNFIQGYTFIPTVPASGRLRLVHEGSTVTAYYRDNGTWIPVLSGPSIGDSSDAVLYAFTSRAAGTRPDVTMTFDNFSVSGGRITCPVWWADGSPDWQPLSGR